MRHASIHNQAEKMQTSRNTLMDTNECIYYSIRLKFMKCHIIIPWPKWLSAIPIIEVYKCTILYNALKINKYRQRLRNLKPFFCSSRSELAIFRREQYDICMKNHLSFGRGYYDGR